MTASCGGFICSKNALTALNTLYIAVSVVLITVGAYAKGASVVTSVPVVAGIIAAGVFLLIVAIIGLYGASRHHQVILFFYMIVLFLVFLIQFFIAVACLAMNESQVQKVVKEGWVMASNDTIYDAERTFNCCGLNHNNDIDDRQVKCHDEWVTGCLIPITNRSNEASQMVGGIGLFFSFSEILGIWLAMRYRNQKNPRANPDLYL